MMEETIMLNMKQVMSKNNSRMMLTLIKELLDAQDAENFASFRFNVNEKKNEYYIIAGKANGNSIQEKYDDSLTKIKKLEHEKFMLEQDIEVYVHAGKLYEEKLKAAVKFINGVKTWSECYPEEIFKEPDPELLHGICKEAGTTLDAISAMVLRRYTKTWGEEAVKVLSLIEKDGE